MLPAGHYQQISQPRTLGSREKWILGSVLALVAVLAVAVVVAFTSVQKQSRNGCIDVSAATVIGGSELYRCGADARALVHRARRFRDVERRVPPGARRGLPQGRSAGARGAQRRLTRAALQHANSELRQLPPAVARGSFFPAQSARLSTCPGPYVNRWPRGHGW